MKKHRNDIIESLRQEQLAIAKRQEELANKIKEADELNEMKVEIDLEYLIMMMNEYWAIDNNDTCAGATILFLRDMGLTDDKIQYLVGNLQKSDFDIDEDTLSSFSMDKAGCYYRYQI